MSEDTKAISLTKEQQAAWDALCEDTGMDSGLYLEHGLTVVEISKMTGRSLAATGKWVRAQVDAGRLVKGWKRIWSGAGNGEALRRVNSYTPAEE